MRTVLVTGATGAIGSVIGKYLLDEPGTHVRLLLRAHSEAHLRARLQELYAFWGLDSRDRSIAERVEAFAGDVTLPSLGLEPSTLQRLTSEVTHVIHSAGNVKLNQPIADARRSAVDSATHIVSFANACRENGAFQKLEFVSTVGVAGATSGVVPERPLPDVQSFRNTYEAAKAEAEAYVRAQIALGLPATIHRPSMVVGDSENGRIIQFQVFYYLCEFLSGRRTAGVVPRTGDTRLDIVPVDYVARAILMSSTSPEATGRIFHLCAGPLHAPIVSDLTAHVRAFFASHGRSVPRLRRLSPALLRAVLPLASRMVPDRLRKTLQSLPFFLAYLDMPQTFANVESQRFFAAGGLFLPPVERVLDATLSYYVARKAGPGPLATTEFSAGAA